MKPSIFSCQNNLLPSFRRLVPVVLCAAGFLGSFLAAPANASTLVDVQFYSAKNPYDLGVVKTGFAAIGVGTNDYWNGVSRDGASPYDWLTYVTVSNLLAVDGTPTGAWLSLANAPGAWDNGVADAMYNTYLYPFNGGNITVTVTNLPDGTYDICVYGHGNVQGGMTGLNGVYQLSSGANNYGTQSTATSGTAWDSTAWQAGQQYVLFSGVTVVGGQPVVLTCLPGAGGEALISGMQISPTGSVSPVAPVIVSQPTNDTVTAGANATFAVVATGTAPLSYQWSLDGTGPLTGETNATLSLPDVQVGQSGNSYSVLVSNSAGSTNSTSAVLTVNPPPTNGPVTLLDVQFFAAKNPNDLSVVKTGFAAIGQTAGDYWNGVSRDGASSTDWLTYVALSNLTNADGSTTGVGLSLANAPGAWDNGVADAMYNTYLYPFDGGNITVTVTNLPDGSYDIYVYGHGNVQGGMTGLNGVYQLSSGTNDYGTQSTATSGTAWDSAIWQLGQQYVLFSGVTVTGGQPLVLTCLPGAGGEALISGMQIAPSGSVPAVAPVIVSQPVNQTVTAGANVTLAVTAMGTSPLSYQWSLDGTGPLTGETNSTLSLPDVQVGQSGNSYSVLVSNSAGSTNSASAVLTVNPPPTYGPVTLLDVQFFAAKNPYDLSAVKTGFAAIGQTAGDYWNGVSRDGASAYDWLSYVALSNLTNADGTVTAVGLSLANAPGAWDNGVADAMYNTYLYPFNGGNVTVTVTNLTAGTYDIYVYGHGNVQGGMTGLNGVYQLSSGGVDYGTLSTATSGTAWDSTIWQEGQQYVLFSGVTVAGGQPVVLTCLPGAGGEALISGMQIAPSGSVPAGLPVIVNQPNSQTVTAGANVTFAVGATGTAPLSYQWSLDGTGALAGETNSTLTLTNVQVGQSGNSYSVLVGNSAGSTNSASAVLTVNQGVPGALLDVQFYSAKNPYDLGTVKTGLAAIGQTTNDYWNGVSRDGVSDTDWLTYVVLNNLTNADGTVSAVGLSLANAPGAWDNGVADAMYNTYLYPFDGGNITVTVTNLPDGSYDIYVYGHGNVQGGMTGLNGVYQLSAGTNDYGTQSTATSGTAWDSTLWQAGQQYVLFNGVSVTNGQPVVLTCLPGDGGEALISGMQIAQQLAITNVTSSVIFGRPVLKMSARSGSLILSWQASAKGFVLESSANTKPFVWTPVVATQVINAGRISVTLPISAAGQLYRLDHP